MKGQDTLTLSLSPMEKVELTFSYHTYSQRHAYGVESFLDWDIKELLFNSTPITQAALREIEPEIDELLDTAVRAKLGVL